jgi:hypothetical protein
MLTLRTIRPRRSTQRTRTRHKTVRITLPPSPSPSETESSMQDNPASPARRSQSIHGASSQTSSGQVVLPSDKVAQEERFQSGSKWSQYDLALLRVKFHPLQNSDLSELNVEHCWSDSQRQSVIFFFSSELLTVRNRG